MPPMAAGRRTPTSGWLSRRRSPDRRRPSRFRLNTSKRPPSPGTGCWARVHYRAGGDCDVSRYPLDVTPIATMASSGGLGVVRLGVTVLGGSADLLQCERICAGRVVALAFQSESSDEAVAGG